MSLAELKSLEQHGSKLALAELQKRLSLGLINPQPPDVLAGETVFCTFCNFDENSYGLYMWVIVLGKEVDTDGDITYQFNVEGKGPIRVKSKYVWTKEQVEYLPVPHTPPPYIPSWERNFILPEGVKVKDPEAAIQALLNLLRDAEVMGLAGHTNLAPVKCKVDGLCLGHFNKLADALGPEVCLVLNAKKLNNG